MPSWVWYVSWLAAMVGLMIADRRQTRRNGEAVDSAITRLSAPVLMLSSELEIMSGRIKQLETTLTMMDAVVARLVRTHQLAGQASPDTHESREGHP